MEQKEVQLIRQYSKSFKQKVIEEYRAGGITQRALQRKYDIRGHCAILNWRRQLAVQDNGNLGEINPPAVSQKKEVKSHDELRQRIKDLERQLEDQKLLAEMYERMIEKAEKELKVSIRKKPNTK